MDGCDVLFLAGYVLGLTLADDPQRCKTAGAKLTGQAWAFGVLPEVARRAVNEGLDIGIAERRAETGEEGRP